MRGQDLMQITRGNLFTANKRAFDEIFGDPFEEPEPETVDGIEQARQPTTRYYQILRSRSPIAAMKNNFDEGKTTRNPAAPNIIDFLCDVERIVTNTLTPIEMHKFRDVYIYEDTESNRLTPDERTSIEQRLGRMFRANHISPVSKYFMSIRRKKNGNTRRNTTDQCTD